MKISSGNNYKLFITSDTKEVVQEAIEEFGIDKMVIIDGQILHIAMEDGLNNLKHDCSKISKTILDFSFMQNCDASVISESSKKSFSRIMINSYKLIYDK